jgi:hypothetical protein
MSQTDRLRSIDARIRRSMHRHGLADSGVYQLVSTGQEYECRPYIDRNVETVGEDGITTVLVTVIDLLHDEVPASAQKTKGRVTVGTESWPLARILHRDESRTRWIASDA